MAILKVGEAQKASDASTSSLSITYTSTTGNLLCVVVRTPNSDGTITTSMTDGTNVFFPIGRVNNSAGAPSVSLQSFYAYNITGTASPIVVTFSSAMDFVWAFVVEFSGIATVSPLDAHTETATAATAPLSTASITTTQANTALVIAASQPAFATYTAAGAYTIIDGTITDVLGGFGGVAYQIASGIVSGAQTITSNDNTVISAVLVAAFSDTAIVSTSKVQSTAGIASALGSGFLGGMNM